MLNLISIIWVLHCFCTANPWTVNYEIHLIQLIFKLNQYLNSKYANCSGNPCIMYIHPFSNLFPKLLLFSSGMRLLKLLIWYTDGIWNQCWKILLSWDSTYMLSTLYTEYYHFCVCLFSFYPIKENCIFVENHILCIDWAYILLHISIFWNSNAFQSWIDIQLKNETNVIINEYKCFLCISTLLPEHTICKSLMKL